MDSSAKILRFEAMLEQVSDNTKRHALWLANKSLDSSMYYMRMMIKGHHYSVGNDPHYKGVF